MSFYTYLLWTDCVSLADDGLYSLYDRIVSMGILLGLLAAIFWGTGDFCARYATQHIGTYRTLFFMQFIGFAGLSIYLLAMGQLQHLLTSTSWQPWLWALCAALLTIVSSLALYRAFEIGTLTLVSPITSSYAAVTALLAFLSGEVLTRVHSIALWLVLCGIVIASTPLTQAAHTGKVALVFPWHASSLRGIGWALVASLGYGITCWMLAFHVTPLLGGIVPVWLIRGTTPCVLAVCMPLTRQSLVWPSGNVWWFLIGVGVFDTLAYIAYTSGLLQGQVSIVTMLASLYSAVTVLLAWIFLREKLQKQQWLGLGIIFIGVALINI